MELYAGRYDMHQMAAVRLMALPLHARSGCERANGDHDPRTCVQDPPKSKASNFQHGNRGKDAVPDSEIAGKIAGLRRKGAYHQALSYLNNRWSQDLKNKYSAAPSRNRASELR